MEGERNGGDGMRITILKAQHRLVLSDNGCDVLCARIALGRNPVGAKRREGDGKTPEGTYQICLAKAQGKYGQSLGLNYPNVGDARLAYAGGLIDSATLHAVENAISQGRRPPWGSPMGGEIHIHAGGTDTDWTEGCVALSEADMAVLYEHRSQIEDIEILP